MESKKDYERFVGEIVLSFVKGSDTCFNRMVSKCNFKLLPNVSLIFKNISEGKIEGANPQEALCTLISILVNLSRTANEVFYELLKLEQMVYGRFPEKDGEPLCMYGDNLNDN